MIIDLATINFAGGGGGGTPAKLQEKTVGIMTNGTTVIAPDEGFNGLSEVEVNVAISGPSSAIDFSSIGYDNNLSAEINAQFNDDVAYSKTLYDEWNPATTSPGNYFKYDKKLVYVPLIDTSNVTNMQGMFNGCTNLTTIPLLDTSKVTKMNDMFDGCYNLTSIPLLDTSNVTTMYRMFYNCDGLTTIPLLDTSNVNTMESMFKDCGNLTTIPLLDTSNVTKMNEMFYYCSKLTSIPQLNTSNVTTMNSMFYNCTSLTTISQLNTSNVTSVGQMFQSCNSLTSIPLLDFSKVTSISTFFGYSNITTLTDLGGFKDLKINWSDGYGLQKCPNLTYQSVMNVINNLYDFRGNGDSTTTRTIKFHANSLALLSDADKAIATGKGWILS